MTIRAYLEVEQEATRGDPIWTMPIASFVVAQGDGQPESGKATLTLYECQYETFDAGTPPSEKTEIAVLSFDLKKNTESAKDGQATPPAFKVSRPKLKSGWRHRWKNTRRKAIADFGLYLGGKNTIWLKVPPRQHAFHREGFYFEVGFVLEWAGQRYERLEWGKHAFIYADYVRRMLRLKTKVTGAFKVGGPERKHDVLGRFNDPKRNPSVEPEQVKNLTGHTMKALMALEEGGPPVDVDGLRFFHWDATPLVPKARDETIERIVSGSATLQQAIADARSDEPFLKGDIQKAYFVIHDVGMDGSPLAKDFWKASMSRLQKKSVHGFLNKDGSFAVRYDFHQKGAGVVYQGTWMGEWIKWAMLNIETTPVVELDDGDTDWLGRKYPTMGVGRGKHPQKKGKVTLYWKWPHSLLDGLADLYVFASARANHLLTVTCHLECDRNLGYSQIHYEYPESKSWTKRLKNAGGRTGHGKMRNGPSNVHGDPYCFPLQVFYDKITERLNRLAKEAPFGFRLELPQGVRYGIHPDRILHQDHRDPTKLLRKLGNRSDAIHTFPHQSHPNPELFRMKTKDQKLGKTNYKKKYWE